MKIPNDFNEKIREIGIEKTIEVLELMKRCYQMGIEDGRNAMYDEMTA